MDIDFIERLERKLEDDLPGLPSQLKMAPIGREDHLITPSQYKDACVMTLIYPKKDDWHVVLIQRTITHPNDPHSGQISLPGGKMEDTDHTHADCALRETQEEVGINAEDVGIIGELTPLYVGVSNFLIYPFIGFTTQEPNFEPQASEVQKIIEVPVDLFVGDRYKRKKHMNIRGNVLKNVPFYEVYDHVLWGATAMIMSEFGSVIEDVY